MLCCVLLCTRRQTTNALRGESPRLMARATTAQDIHGGYNGRGKTVANLPTIQVGIANVFTIEDDEEQNTEVESTIRWCGEFNLKASKIEQF